MLGKCLYQGRRYDRCRTSSGINRFISMTTAPRLRIASLVPSLTELAVSLGLQDYVVARTGFCIHPSAIVRDIPKLGGTKDVRLDRLREIGASHLLVNVDENRLETMREIETWPPAARPQIVVTHPQGPDDVPPLIDQMVTVFADAPGITTVDRQRLRERAAQLRGELHDVLARTRAQPWRRQQVLYLIWRAPWMTVARDTYVSRMLTCVNWHSMPALDGGATGAGRYPVLHGDEPWLSGVDRVLLSSEPYSFTAAHVGEAQALCPNAQVQLVDGEALSWYGPRTVDGLQILQTLASLRQASCARVQP